jgi:hypothetical protein
VIVKLKPHKVMRIVVKSSGERKEAPQGPAERGEDSGTGNRRGKRNGL